MAPMGIPPPCHITPTIGDAVTACVIQRTAEADYRGSEGLTAAALSQ